MLGGDNMKEEKFLSETGADFTTTAPDEESEEEILYDWDGEKLNEQTK